MTNSSIWFVVIAYHPNTTKLKQLLRELSSFHYLVIWNSHEEFSGTSSEVKHIQNEKNMGFGEGANKGIAYALKRGAEWIIVLNQDVSIAKNALRQFVHIVKSCHNDIVGPFAGCLDVRRWTTYLGFNKQTEPDYVSGSFMAVNTRVFSKIGFFYRPYFMYYEDVDFCVRAGRVGFRLKAIHIDGISHTDTMTLGKGSFLHAYYLARNHLLFLERQAPWTVKIYEIIRMPKTVWEHYKKKEWGGLLGIIDYCIRSFGEKHL